VACASINDEDAEEEFKRCIKQTAFKHIDLPPPLELIAKRTYKEKEPVLTGAPIPFLSLASLAGGRFPKEEACGKTKAQRQQSGEELPSFPVDLKPDVATLRANTNNIQ